MAPGILIFSAIRCLPPPLFCNVPPGPAEWIFAESTPLPPEPDGELNRWVPLKETCVQAVKDCPLDKEDYRLTFHTERLPTTRCRSAGQPFCRAPAQET